jgi:ubiquinone/menaquinone biosynthesis C-methylase UbiE
MSQDSANVYETSTETLFLGRQDAMQRISLEPIIAQSKQLEADSVTQQAQGQQQSSSEKKPMRVLEIACGTGRFMTFVRDNLPLDTEYAAIDLSPFYLEKARDNDAYWRKTRLSQELEEQGTTNGKTNAVTTIPPAKLIQANAESLPFENESFDAVLCVYLFHELPREARAQVASEMARVSKAGGTVVLTDSMQKGDRPPLDGALQNFEKMNEPYYVDYTLDDLPSHFEKAGLTPMEKAVRSSTKMLSFRKEE